ncbi:MAG: amidohydrolase family protein, partial [Firmicutes bacterium]|nr:amidohydrolase family protein [Bacillota bacterium]
MYSVLIRGGQIIDGTAKPSYQADIAVYDDRIAAVAENIKEPAQVVIDAAGQVVAPGFIDIHSHTDETIFSTPLSDSKLMQGVTSEVIGNCGIGLFPTSKEHVADLENYAKVHGFVLGPDGITWEKFSDYADELTKLPLGPNLLPLVAHGALRIAVMGFDNRPPTDTEMATM